MIADPQAAVGIMVVSAAYVSADRVVRWTGQWGDGIAVAGRLAGVKTDRRRRSMKPSVVDVTVRTAAGQCGGSRTEGVQYSHSASPAALLAVRKLYLANSQPTETHITNHADLPLLQPQHQQP